MLPIEGQPLSENRDTKGEMGTKLSQILYPNLKELDTEDKERTTKTTTLTENQM